MIEIGQQVEKFEKIFLSFLTIFSGLLIYLLIIDFNIIPNDILLSKDDRFTLANIYEKRNTVKRRASQLPVWNEIFVNDTLYEKEQIYTASDSSTKIKFQDGTILEIDENSLVMLKRNMGLLSVEVLKGEIYGSTTNNNKFEVITKNLKAIVNSNSKIKLQVKENKPTISVIDGNTSINTEAKTIELKSNQVGSIDDKGKVEIKDILIDLMLPVQNEKIYTIGNSEITFKWNFVNAENNEITDLNLEISKEQNFSTKFKIIKIANNANSTKIKIDTDGILYWHIKAFNSVKKTYIYSIDRKLVLEKDTTATLLRPYNGEEISYQDKIRNSLIFDWEKADDVDKYVFELSNTDRFDKIIKNKEADSPPITLEFLAPGTYYWRLKYVSGKRINTKWSDISKFVISDIKLNFPKFDQEIYLPNDKDELFFKWSKLYGINTYYIEISKNKDFSDSIINNKISTNLFNWNSTSIGKFYWRIKACDFKGNVLSTSTLGTFTITRDKPKAPIIDTNYKLQIEVE